MKLRSPIFKIEQTICPVLIQIPPSSCRFTIYSIQSPGLFVYSRTSGLWQPCRLSLETPNHSGSEAGASVLAHFSGWPCCSVLCMRLGWDVLALRAPCSGLLTPPLGGWTLAPCSLCLPSVYSAHIRRWEIRMHIVSHLSLSPLHHTILNIRSKMYLVAFLCSLSNLYPPSFSQWLAGWLACTWL